MSCEFEWETPIRLTGIIGSSKSVDLVSTATSVLFDERSGTSEATVYLEAILTGIELYDSVTWSCDLDNLLVNYEGASLTRLVDPEYFTETSATITVSVVSSGLAYTDTLVLGKEYLDNNATIYLGIKDSAPNYTDQGENLVDGDSFLLETYDETNEEYVYEPYVYSDGVWVTIADTNGNVSSEYYDILMNSATSIFSEGKDVSTSSAAIYGYFKNLVATNAVVENLATQNILLQDDGSIRSDYYNQDGLKNDDSDAEHGFYIGADGVSKFWSAVLENVTISGTGEFEGNIINDLLTATKGDPPNSFSFPDKTKWAVSDIYDVLTDINEIYVDSLPPGDEDNYVSYATTVIGTYGSDTIIKMLRINSAGSKSLYAFDGIIVWDSNSDPYRIYDGTSSLELTSPQTFSSSDYLYYCSVSTIVSSISSTYTNGVAVSASGTLISSGVSFSVSSVTPYSNYFVLTFSNGTTMSVVSSSYYNISGTIYISSNPDVFEIASVTPKETTSTIGTASDKFESGFFTNLYTSGLSFEDNTYSITAIDSLAWVMELPFLVDASAISSSVPDTANVILQFDRYVSNSDSNQTFNFPITFPNRCVGWYTSGMFVGSATKITAGPSTFSFDRDNQVNGDVYFYMLAIGF